MYIASARICTLRTSVWEGGFLESRCTVEYTIRCASTSDFTFIAAEDACLSADLGSGTLSRLLAILGGEPSFEDPLHVGAPNVGDRAAFFARMTTMFDRNWLTNRGPLDIELESRLADYLGVRHCVTMCNGTIALEIAIRALGLKGEVIIPAFTFIATAHALQWHEVRPVFCDIESDSCNLDPTKVEAMITPRTSGIIGVHLWGRSCDTEALETIAKRHGIEVIFDAAHAFGCTHKGKKVGSFGHAEIFSFHATKFFNTFEGGALATNDEELADRVRLMKNFGFGGVDDVTCIGINGKMTEAAAAMGLTNLDSLSAFVDSNRRNYNAYRKNMAPLPGLRVFEYDEKEACNYQYVVVLVDEKKSGLSRDELVAALHAEGVLARRYFYPGCHRAEPYRSYFPNAGLLLPETERLASQVLLLPTGSAVEPEAVATICGILADAMSSRDRVRQAHQQSLASG